MDSTETNFSLFLTLFTKCQFAILTPGSEKFTGVVLCMLNSRRRSGRTARLGRTAHSRLVFCTLYHDAVPVP